MGVGVVDNISIRFLAIALLIASAFLRANDQFRVFPPFFFKSTLATVSFCVSYA